MFLYCQQTKKNCLNKLVKNKDIKKGSKKIPVVSFRKPRQEGKRDNRNKRQTELSEVFIHLLN